MRPADVLERGNAHVGYAAGIAAPVPAREGLDAARATTRDLASPTGFTQELQLRLGLGSSFEAGVRASPAVAGVDVRRQVAGEEDWVATLGAGVDATFLPGALVGEGERLELDTASRFGGHVEALLGRNFGDVIRIWTGPRLGVSVLSVSGTNDVGESIDASGTVGFFAIPLGMATGYRWIHAAVEIAVGWAFGRADVGGDRLSLSGVVLYPSFGIFVRP